VIKSQSSGEEIVVGSCAIKEEVVGGLQLHDYCTTSPPFLDWCHALQLPQSQTLSLSLSILTPTSSLSLSRFLSEPSSLSSYLGHDPV
jgi:hypothetical protein